MMCCSCVFPARSPVTGPWQTSTAFLAGHHRASTEHGQQVKESLAKEAWIVAVQPCLQKFTQRQYCAPNVRGISRHVLLFFAEP